MNILKKILSSKSLLILPFFIMGFYGIQLNIDNNDISVAIPTAGNSWIVDNCFVGEKIISENGIKNWEEAENKIRVYFKLSSIGKLNFGFNAKVISGKSKIKCTINGIKINVELSNTEYKNRFIGTCNITKPGYYFVELEGLEKEGSIFAEIKEILIGGEATKQIVYFARDDFYWGRRGPSVHLSYKVPDDAEGVEYFYNEITVPKGSDVIGSYYMANGFAHGYFGIQVNSETERRVLFSVWSPYKTQDPNEIPDEYKIELLKKGEGVYSGKFGNEGSGGQSYLKYNWKAGNTYRFLLKGKPDKNNCTIFTAYFYPPEVGEWKLIASFKRPFTTSYLTKIYSFLENFHTETGAISRKAYYTNQWIKNKNGKWFELEKAKFTADATARKKSRMDYSGGVENGLFFLKNCGFFNETTKIGSFFTRKLNKQKPTINFEKLP